MVEHSADEAAQISLRSWKADNKLVSLLLHRLEETDRNTSSTEMKLFCGRRRSAVMAGRWEQDRKKKEGGEDGQQEEKRRKTDWSRS